VRVHALGQGLRERLARASGEVHERLYVQLVHPPDDLVQPFGTRALQRVTRRGGPLHDRRHVCVHVDDRIASARDGVLLGHEHAPGLEVQQVELRASVLVDRGRRRRAGGRQQGAAEPEAEAALEEIASGMSHHNLLQ
jgi:hypothetical protein